MTMKKNHAFASMFIPSLIIAAIFVLLCSFTGDPCKAIKKDGTRCKSTIVLASGYCRAHDPNAKHCAFIKKDKTQCKMVVKDDEKFCRFHIDK
jgi:hypothetical protein